jgi:galactokinase
MKFFAPGRVNLIGEHLDYNGGLVLPAALTMGITATYVKRNDNRILLKSTSHELVKEIAADESIEFNTANDWTNYPLGVIEYLRRENFHLPACEISFSTTLPEGSGLSSSAAIEVLSAYMLLAQSGDSINPVWLANFCREVENDFIGVKCGIMDQYAVALGKKHHALLINCAALRHQYIHIELGDYRLVIMDTRKPRSLIKSKYNERKQQCEEALRLIRYAKHDIEHLADAGLLWLDVLADEQLKKRARHVITENLRVKQAVKVLEQNDLEAFGKLLNSSHESLKHDYEVTGPELDLLVETAQRVKGCLGARMTGAGFGGCAIALVHHSELEKFTKQVSEEYLTRTGITCAIYQSEIGDGVRNID